MLGAKRSTADVYPLSELHSTDEGGRLSLKSKPGHLQLLCPILSSHSRPPSLSPFPFLCPLPNGLHTQCLNHWDRATNLRNRATPGRTARRAKGKQLLAFYQLILYLSVQVHHFQPAAILPSNTPASTWEGVLPGSGEGCSSAFL